jgi:hypothetical protein
MAGDDQNLDPPLGRRDAADSSSRANLEQGRAAAVARTAEPHEGQGATPDWRARLAGDDKDALKRLARFPDEASLYKSYRSLEQRLSSGEMKKPLADNASAEEVAAWRRDNGLPENQDGYLDALNLSNGVVIGEADKPLVREFAAAALDGNVAPEQFSRMVAKYYEIQDAQRAAREDADAAFKQTAESELRAEWQGAAFRQNLNAIQNLMAGWPEGLAVRVLAGRSPDGRKLGDDPAFVRQLASLARELNPPVSLVPGGASDPSKGLNDRLSEIKGWMSAARGTPAHGRYWNDEKVQAEYRDLIDSQGRMKGRDG